jgi:hypothetical protein
MVTLANCTVKAFIDWNQDGDFSDAGENISAYMMDCQIQRGFDDPGDPRAHIASVGVCTLLLKNTDRRFSPSYSSGPYYSDFKPLLPIRIRVTDDTTTWTVFTGYITSINPDMTGKKGDLTATIQAMDVLGLLSRYPLSMPLCRNIRSDQLVARILAAAHNGTARVYVFDVSNQPAVDDTFSLSYTDAAAETTLITYRFKNTLAVANDVKIGTTKTLTARNLCNAINNDTGAGTNYETGTERGTYFTATYSGATITLTAVSKGAWANDVTFGGSGSWYGIGSNTAGADSDLPVSLETGDNVFPYAADQWSEDRGSAFTALGDVALSEWGYIWVAADGTLMSMNRQWFFKQPSEGADISCDNEQRAIDAGLSLEDMFTKVLLNYNPRAKLTSGVIAKASGPIQVPAGYGVERWTSFDPPTNDQSIVVKIPAKDGDNWQYLGIDSVIWPPEYNTDYTVSLVDEDDDELNWNGIDWSQYIYMSAAINGADIDVSFLNSSGVALYVIGFKLRGVGLKAYEPQQIILADATALAAYGVQALNVDIPLPITHVFARTLAQYLKDRYSTLRRRLPRLGVSAYRVLGGVNPNSMDIGSVVQVTEYQTGLSGTNRLIMGVNARYTKGGQAEIMWDLKTIGATSYWILGDSTYGVLGSTSRLGL